MMRVMVTALTGIAFASLLSACSTQIPRWTPENAGPPTAPAAGLTPGAPLDQRTQPLEFPAGAEPEQKVKLTRDGALLTALKNNQSIAVARFGPRIGETYVPEARAAFDPTLMGTISTGRNSQVMSSTAGTTAGLGSSAGGSGLASAQVSQALQQAQQLLTAMQQPGTQVANTDTTTGSLTVQELFPTGTSVFLSGNALSTDSNLSSDNNQGSWQLGVTQSLLRGAGTAVNLVALRQARNLSARSEHAFRASVLNAATQVELGYWDLVLAEELLKIREFAVKLADEQLRRNQDLLSVGKAIEGDVLASEAEKATRTADLTDAQAAIRTQTIALIELLNPKQAKRWQITFETVDRPDAVVVEMNPDVSEQLAVQYRPELAQARLDAANQELGVTTAKNNLLPRLDLVGSYGINGSGSSTADITRHLGDSRYEGYQIGLQFQTPILNRAEKARYARARLLSEQAERSVTDLELNTVSNVRQAAVNVQKLWDRLTATGEAVKSHTEQLRIAQGRFEVGKTTTLDLLIVQRDLIQAQIDEVTARVNYIEALTSLYAAEGTLLERRGITLDTEKCQTQD